MQLLLENNARRLDAGRVNDDEADRTAARENSDRVPATGLVEEYEPELIFIAGMSCVAEGDGVPSCSG
jgi:hypothetical protein